MGNGDFAKGVWNQLPSNCSNSFTLKYLRCAEYGFAAFTECLNWVVSTGTECVQGVWNTVKNCSWWSWIFCVLWAVVVTFVCTVLAVIAVVVCAAVTVVELVFCLLWSVVTIVGCFSNANGGTAFLLTDGTVMMQESKSAPLGLAWSTVRWWKLTPDQLGSYANGTWSRLADSNVARRYYASAVLVDGRVVVCGGEYSGVVEDFNNTCEVYDPVANIWTPFASPTMGDPPTPWSEIGDAPCTLLPDGTLLVGSISTRNVAKLDPSTLTWMSMTPRPSAGPDNSDEDSWVLMPNGTIAAPSCQKPPTTWVYHIAADHWAEGGLLMASVVDAADETGPALLRYDGTALFLGSNEHTAIYSPNAHPPWSNGPDLPPQGTQSLGIVDGPAALLVNGNVLFGAGPTNSAGDFLSPSYFFEFDGLAFNRTNDPPNNDCPTYPTRLLLLPDGDVLFCREDDSSFYAYHSDAAAPQDNWRPIIQTWSPSLAPGSVTEVGGVQFNGLSQAVAYGDDSQTATNYPLVRIVNKETGHVRYCRTFGHATMDGGGNPVPSMGVATGDAVITTSVEIPDDIELGDSSLILVANGIPSEPVDVAIWPILI